MTAKIIGDLQGVKPPPDLSSSYLLVPSAPANHPWVTGGMGHWMIVDKSLVAL